MRLASATAALLVTLASGLVGAGTAVAAEPIVVGSCATSVQGTPGQPVSLSPSAVVQPITDLIRAIPVLGPPLAAPFQQAFTALPPIPIGAVQTGTTTISGATIANQVVAQLQAMPLLGPVIGTLAGSVRSTLTSMCGVAVTGVNQVAAPIQDGSKAIADASQQGTGQTPPTTPPGTTPGTPGTQPGTTPGTTPGNQTGATPVGGVAASNTGFSLYSLGSNYGRVPLFSYGSLPFALPGVYSPSPGVRYGSVVPRAGADQGYNGDPVQTAGQAQALPRLRGVGGVGMPVLLAVLMLSCVTGALVRTWVLRRTPA
ncbi:hypothetical protein [Lentzea sp. NBRC 105346]|uniref:hypothetical protein n=1 Tax=Lentzea sp. NBRC 105346 TaxID=3032205 RepID=UPI0025579386|nr:hypothetical protein [Lentzea sp. NBRC 105346]